MSRSAMGRTAVLLALLMGIGVANPAAAADDDRLRALEDRLRMLEDRLQESEAVIEAQREQLGEQPGSADSDGGFLSSIEVGGHVAASYLYSFNNPATNTFSQTLCQFNCNHNEFSLDAIKLELGRSAANPGTAGFQFDVLYGQNASIFKGLSPDGMAASNIDGTSDTEFFVQQAYLSYNLNGIEFKAGKFETLLGYELIDTNDNANVTHGILFTFAIPLFHTGALASGSFSEEFGWSVGFVNGFNNTVDTGDNKAILAQLRFERGPIFASYSGYFGTLGEQRPSISTGGLVGDNNTQTQIHDIIVQYSPSDSLTAWINADIGKTEARRFPGSDPQFFGLAAGVKAQINEKLYVALRGEYMNDDQGSRLGGVSPTPLVNRPFFDEIDAWSGTLTLGYQLAPGLLARVEYRRDDVDCDNPSCAFFRDSSDGGTKSNDFGIFELIYSFE